jgi:ABC-2 type transport system permease protein
MKSIIVREIKSFFGSPIGYLVIAIFLIINGLFLWVLKRIQYLNIVFDMTCFTDLLLILQYNASSSDEKKTRNSTYKTTSIWQIVSGKP